MLPSRTTPRVLMLEQPISTAFIKNDERLETKPSSASRIIVDVRAEARVVVMTSLAT